VRFIWWYCVHCARCRLLFTPTNVGVPNLIRSPRCLSTGADSLNLQFKPTSAATGFSAKTHYRSTKKFTSSEKNHQV